MSGFSEIKLTVGGALDVPDHVWAFKAHLQRDLRNTKIIWSIEILAEDEQTAKHAMNELRHALADELLSES